MNEIQGSASYVRNPEAPGAAPDPEALQHASDVTPPDANVRIWELLETPQTVETICRVLRNEFDLPPASCTEGVKVVLTKLYREDLIQQSPDT
jgi:Coenzyme PQQ synthesis protein D (PqqD)